jgi:4'-phosphopantetheinyl transferase EntD
MTFLPGLFGPAIATAEALPPYSEEGLLPLEETFIARAVGRRRAEFATGRALARRALAALGEAPVAIAAGADRSPRWPDSIVGSISHSSALCGVALGRKADGVRLVGLDIELAEPLPQDLWETVLTPAEHETLSAMPAAKAGLAARVIFSAKECVYKAQYPVSGVLFGFEMFEVALDMAGETFRATWQGDVGPFNAGLTWRGRLRVAGGHVVTGFADMTG